MDAFYYYYYIIYIYYILYLTLIKLIFKSPENTFDKENYEDIGLVSLCSTAAL
jgi:hypothetical protein